MSQAAQRGKSLCGIRASLCLWIVLLCLAAIPAMAETGAVLTEDEWTWEPGGTATFSGILTLDGPDLTDAVLKLELYTDDPEHQGEIVFTEINGKTVKIRKRSDTLTADLTGSGTENAFTGEWYPPGDAAPMSRAVLRFRAESAEGTEIASAELRLGSEEESGVSPESRLLGLAQQLKIILIAAAVILWAAAAARYLILRKKAH